jgi:hypothetical protein
MRAGDEAFERLRLAIEELAGGDGAELVREARIEARARVRSMLTESMAQAMLDRARQELEQAKPPSADEQIPPPRPSAATEARSAPVPTLGWYVYGVIAADARPPSGQRGVDPHHEVTTLRNGALAAVVSQVPLEDFGEERLRERLADAAWLEHTARRHEEVLETYRERGTLIPMRLCSIYRTDDGVREMLGREAEAFEEALARLQGKSEWGVKVFANDATGDGTGAPEPAAPGGVEGAGAAYMQQRSREHEHRRRLERDLEEACERIHGRLCSLAVDGLTSAPQRAEVTDHPGQMVLNGVYLVADREQATFDHEVEVLQAEFSKLGLELEQTGPWPAYNFVRGKIGAPW